MRPSQFPTVSPKDLLQACISGVKDPATAARLNVAAPQMLATAANYHAAAQAKSLHSIPQVESVGPASKADMQGLYNDQMSNQRGSARSFYNLIKSSAQNSKCPLCGVGTVRTLDHHLPKGKYPDLSVCPYNLVPSCDYCQSGKLAKHPTHAGQQTIHPYYDDYSKEQWIFGKLDNAGIPVVSFFVNPPTTWADIDRQRVSHHFDTVKLKIVYMSNAADELASLRDSLMTLRANGGHISVFNYLQDERIRWSKTINCWQHIMYQTLANDIWFVNGGYIDIPI